MSNSPAGKVTPLQFMQARSKLRQIIKKDIQDCQWKTATLCKLKVSHKKLTQEEIQSLDSCPIQGQPGRS